MPEKRFEQTLNLIFELPENEGEDKVATLTQAVGRLIKPGMTLQIMWQNGAAISEILRQFSQSRPGFTLVNTMFSGYLTNLVHAGLVKKLIVSNCSHIYPSPSPIKVLQRAYSAGALALELWSWCTVQQKLMAGAQGLPFLPIKSIKGSSMADDNKDTYATIADPFGGKERVAVAKAINPDVAIIHALAADRHGNAIIAYPHDETIWGPRASKAVIVTTERLVSTDFIRRHSPMVKLPGYLVNAVVMAPFALHPFGLSNFGLEEIDGYGEDGDFIMKHRKATDKPESMDSWVKDWILSCPDHEAYLKKIGRERLASLVSRTSPSTSRNDTEPLIKAAVVDNEAYNQTEMMVVAASRVMKEKVIQNRYSYLLMGVGTVALAAVMAYYRLRKEGISIDMISGVGEVGFRPSPPEHYFWSLGVVSTAKMLPDNVEVYSVIVGGANGKCMSALGAAQVDKHANLNSTLLGPGRFMMGAGGANDAATMSSEVVVVAKQSADRFLDRLSYIAAPGNKVKTLVSNLGIFEKDKTGELELVGCYPDPKLTLAERVAAVKANCGWNLKVSDKVAEVEPPSREELTLLRLLDPKGLFIE